MDNTTLLTQIGDLIDEKLDDKLEPIKQDLKEVKERLETVELKVELVNKRVEQSQDETISALSELINTGFNMHEKRIKKLEEASQSSHTH